MGERLNHHFQSNTQESYPEHRSEKGRRLSFEDVDSQILPEFKKAYSKKVPVIGAGIGTETTRRGLKRVFLQAYLGKEPTPDQQKMLKKTFKKIHIRYITTTVVPA